ncbi:hypothetical protein [Marivirga sp.]|uniref:hypothetical protein n=1 Tax=Marivirga sp. TaxID=2018662 RepID=UPI0025FF018B|nr:hypothetical protein [Marivirga sp.]
MNWNKSKTLIFLFILICSGYCHGQNKATINIDSVKLNGYKITLSDITTFLDNQNANQLNFKEYIEEFPTSSGDKLNYYFDEHIKFTIVFFGEKSSLQSITLFSNEPTLQVNDVKLSVGLSKEKFNAFFPEIVNGHESPYSGIISFNLDLNYDYYGNLAFEFKNDRLERIFLRFIE